MRKSIVFIGGISCIALAAFFFLSLRPTTPEGVSIDIERRVTGGQVTRDRSPKTVLRFGFDPRLDPIEDAKIYYPFLLYLHDATGYHFELRFTKSTENIVDNIGRGTVQFAAIGSVSYIKAMSSYGARIMVRGLNDRGRAEYRSAIFTRPESDINSIADLRGRSFAFGDVNSTQGHLIPRLILEKNGLRPEDLSRYGYTGSHQMCAEAVISNRFDAGGMQDTLALDLSQKGFIRIIAWSDYFPSSGIAARKDMDPKIFEAVKKALLEFDPSGRDKSRLYHWEKTEMPRGFTRAFEFDYTQIRDAMLDMGLIKKGTPP